MRTPKELNKDTYIDKVYQSRTSRRGIQYGLDIDEDDIDLDTDSLNRRTYEPPAQLSQRTSPGVQTKKHRRIKEMKLDEQLDELLAELEEDIDTEEEDEDTAEINEEIERIERQAKRRARRYRMEMDLDDEDDDELDLDDDDEMMEGDSMYGQMMMRVKRLLVRKSI